VVFWSVTIGSLFFSWLVGVFCGVGFDCFMRDRALRRMLESQGLV